MKKSIVVIVILSIIIAVLTGYIIWDKYTSQENNSINNNVIKDNQVEENITEEKNDNHTEDSDNKNTEIKFENYDIDNIKNIIITTYVEENGNPVEKKHTVTSMEEIIEILKVLDEAKYIKNIPSETGFICPTSIEVNHKEDPSTSIIFINNGNVAINYTVGVAETQYAEYSLNRKNFKTELIQKYFS